MGLRVLKIIQNRHQFNMRPAQVQVGDPAVMSAVTPAVIPATCFFALLLLEQQVSVPEIDEVTFQPTGQALSLDASFMSTRMVNPSETCPAPMLQLSPISTQPLPKPMLWVASVPDTYGAVTYLRLKSSTTSKSFCSTTNQGTG